MWSGLCLKLIITYPPFMNCKNTGRFGLHPLYLNRICKTVASSALSTVLSQQFSVFVQKKATNRPHHACIRLMKQGTSNYIKWKMHCASTLLLAVRNGARRCDGLCESTASTPTIVWEYHNMIQDSCSPSTWIQQASLDTIDAAMGCCTCRW